MSPLTAFRRVGCRKMEFYIILSYSISDEMSHSSDSSFCIIAFSLSLIIPFRLSFPVLIFALVVRSPGRTAVRKIVSLFYGETFFATEKNVKIVVEIASFSVSFIHDPAMLCKSVDCWKMANELLPPINVHRQICLFVISSSIRDASQLSGSVSAPLNVDLW